MSSYYEKILATVEVKCIDEEVPFEIPQGWEWCRLRDIILGTNAGKSPNCENRPKKSEECGVLQSTSIQENAFLSNENKVLPKHYVINPEHCVRYGDILITRAGPVNRTGIVCMVENNCDKLILSDKTVRIDYMHDYCNPKFLVFVLNSSAIHELVMSATVGMAASQVNVSQGSIQNTLIPFPPSKEQQRIINKLETLLLQIEKYDNAQNKLNELNKTIKDIIKKSVLQEAIQGKLVPQLAEEGTAQELLEQIKTEKQKLVKEGKLKKSALKDSVIFKGDDNKYWEKNGMSVACIDDEIPFEIPSTWIWCRLGDCVKIIGGYAFKSYELKSPVGYRDIRISDISENGLVNKNIVRYDGNKDLDQYLIKENDILIAMTGGTVGKSLLLNYALSEPLLLNQRVAIIRNFWINVEYLNALLHSPYIKQIIDKKKNSTNDNISMSDLNDFLLPLPPLKEQHRIVERFKNVTSIMSR